LKVLDPIASSDEEEDLARLRREGQLLGSVSHPNVVAVEAIGVCSTSGRGYLALEFVEGVDLADRLEIGLTRTEALHVLYQAALGLRALHAAGVVHRDLKPANVLLTANGEVKLVDLGIALEREQSRLTKTGEVLGTPDYMAPEVARGKRPTPAADVYALAATAYRLFAGRPLFELPSPIAVVHAHVKDTPPSFEDLDPPVS
ncbi:MAG: serine/threonine protein kinase, partial [Planctomycetes bacterium]|nr:serine/threonine protein kinase [Planctomycetota bacterium]